MPPARKPNPWRRRPGKTSGVKVVSVNWYERGTTQFQPIAQKLAAVKPDAIDLGVTPPADAGVVFRELSVMGWNGVKVQPVGTGARSWSRSAARRPMAYMGFSGDYEGAQATAKQRELNEGMKKAIGESLNPLQLAPYDSVYALKAGMEAANSIEPADIVKALPTIVFETSVRQDRVRRRANLWLAPADADPDHDHPDPGRQAGRSRAGR